ncbi:MAG: hypothetical protein F6K22_21975 [Okeania sp. SIO2F4]|nr:hypothetical protein [Okeania sp. SIO2F4]
MIQSNMKANLSIRWVGKFLTIRTYAPATYFRPKRPTLKQSQILVFPTSCVSPDYISEKPQTFSFSEAPEKIRRVKGISVASSLKF